MNIKYSISKTFRPVSLGLLLATAAGILSSCHKDHHDMPNKGNNMDTRALQQINLVADRDTFQPKIVDTLLKNPWGLAWSPTGIAWVNDQVTGVSELFNGDGVSQRKPVVIPNATHFPLGSSPVGIVFNSTKGFLLANGQPANFIFANISGTIAAWNPASGDTAQTVVIPPAPAVYTGLALAASNGRNYIYAVDAVSGKIAVWDTAFKPVSMPFQDPTLPAGNAPFGIQLVGNYLYVTYATLGPDGKPASLVGNGIVDEFNTDGSFVKRFAAANQLNAPWAVLQLPASFLGPQNVVDSTSQTPYSSLADADYQQSLLLVANFGNGRINVFTQDGVFKGQLQAGNKAITIARIWALTFAPASATSVDPHRLYFTAGPRDETDGIFGYLINQ